MTYWIEITARAQADAEAACRWISGHLSPAQAERWYGGRFQMIETLQRQPLCCPLAAENGTFPEEIRELLFGNRPDRYRILFTIRDDAVVILSIHPRAGEQVQP